MKLKFSAFPVLIFCISAIITAASACRTAPAEILTPSNPKKLSGCSYGNAETNQKLSYAALISALETYRWSMESLSPGLDRIKASYCTASKQPSDCATIYFTVDSAGNVAAYAAENEPVTIKLKGHAERWMRNLEQQFYRNNCMEELKADEILSKFNLKQ